MTRAAPVVVVAVLALAGCLTPGDDDGPPAVRPEDVVLDVQVEPATAGPGETVQGVATVTNRGSAPVRHYAYCDPVVELTFFGPDGEEVFFEEPGPRCEALVVEVLRPGESKREPFAFAGDVWTREGAVSPAPPGEYTVVAVFRWWTAEGDVPLTDVPEDVREAEARATFTWTAKDGVAAGEPEVRVVAEPPTFGEGGNVTVNATVINQGERPVWYNGICVPPLRFDLERDGEPVQFTPPTFHCLGIDLVPLGPGETLSHEIVWNGTVYEDEQASEAAPGTYTFVVTFRWWPEDDAGGAFHEAVGRADVTYTG